MPHTPAREPRPDSDRSQAIAQNSQAAGKATEANQVLALQRSAGNRAVGDLLRRRTLARNGAAAAAAPAANPLRNREVNRPVTETISHAPAAFSAWNATFGPWNAKWNLVLDQRAEVGKLIVQVRLYSTASDDVKRAWKDAIVNKWSNKFAFAVKRAEPIQIRPGVVDRFEEMYPIRIQIDWVDSPRSAHYVVRANAAGAVEGGRAGLGGTTSMTGWGTADTVDITHEFGHMLGAPEEYFTTDGVDYTYGGTRRGFRDPEGGVMNNPAGPALARNFRLIQTEAASLRGVGVGSTEVVPWR